MTTIFNFFITTALLFLTFTTVGLQSVNAQNYGIGITGGIGASSHVNSFKYVSGDISLDFSANPSMSYHAGVILRQPVTPNLRVQIEPTFIRLGAIYQEPFELRGFQFETDSRTDLLYLHVPLLFQVTSTPAEQVIFGRPRSQTTFHLTGGAFGSYLLDATFSGENTGAPIGIQFQGDFSNDVSNQYSDYDGGFILGGGVERGHSQRIGIEIRAIVSLLNSGDHPEIDFKPKNIAATVSVYYLL
jgi:hypothetical protein